LGSDRLALVHGAFPVALTGAKDFRTFVLRPVERFLRENRGESVVVSLKGEGWGGGGDVQLARVLFERYLKEADGGEVWWTEARIPTLGEVRGKIVLLRRFGMREGAIGSGIDAQHWA
jgi:1-phosphatidylinositol phosphodiesterase